MRRGRAVLVGMATMATMALLLTACGTDAEREAGSSGSSETSDRVEVVRLTGCPECGLPNPFSANVRGNAQALMSLSFDSLAWKDAENEPIPWIATEWESSADGTEWRFTIRDDVTWHDGQPLTAEDVAFSFNYVTDGPAATFGSFAYRSIAQKVTQATVEGSSVVVLTTEGPDATFLDQVAVKVPIIPKHIWESVDDPARFTDPEAMVGSGPYTLESHDSASGRYLFAANDDFFMGPPLVERVEFVEAPDPVRAIQQDVIDVAELGDGSPLTEETLESFDSPDYGRADAGGFFGPVLHFNMLKGFPYDDVRYRQAIAYAVDREEMAERLTLGQGEAANLGLIQPSDSKWIPDDMPTYDHDVEEANSRLDDLGLEDLDGDGNRDLPNGEPFRPELIADSSLNSLVLDLLKEYLNAVGIDAQVTALDRASVDSAGNEAAYQMALMSYGIGSDPEEARSYLWSEAPANWWKAHGWDNAEFDALMEEQRIQVDPEERQETAFAMQRLTAEQVPVLPLYVSNRIAVFDSTVMDGWFYTANGYPVYPGIVNKLTFVTEKRTGFSD